MSTFKIAAKAILPFLLGFTLAYILCLRKPELSEVSWHLLKQFYPQSNYTILFNESDLDRAINPDFINTDVLVFFHIQKTGGTNFERVLTRNLEGDPCICAKHGTRCLCGVPKKPHQLWLFMRYTQNDICGVHPDWTILHECVPNAISRLELTKRKRRYLYFTWLRDPVKRYLSEWKHVQKGGTWIQSRLKCNGIKKTKKLYSLCFGGHRWVNVTLEDFLACPSNQATNRQTRMLANLSLVGCYNHSAKPEEERQRMMLQSAKGNLKNIPFFGLTDYQAESQYIFERTFNLEFMRNFKQRENTQASKTTIPQDLMTEVREKVSLDTELYQFAKELFFQRLDWFHQRDKQMGCTWKRTFPLK